MSKLSRIKNSIILLSIILITSCNKELEIGDEINISVSIPPFADFTRQIVGNRANVHTLIPSGVNAHSFEPNPESMKILHKSNLYFRVGDIFSIENVLLSKINTKNLGEIIDCSANIKIRNNDPHIWLSPENVRVITQNMLNALSEYYPQHKNYFMNNRNKFLRKLDSLDKKISGKLKVKKNRVIFVYHPAWKYLAIDYNLEEIAIEHDGKSPKAQDLENLIRLAQDKGVGCIFFDPHFDETSVKAIAKSAGLKVDSLDPLPEDYLLNLSDIFKKLNMYLK